MSNTRRSFLKTTVAAAALSAVSMPSFAQSIDELVIAYNVNLPSWDPTVGPSGVNPTIQGIYQSVFDNFIHQNPDLSFDEGLITAWGWNDDLTQIWMDVREGVTWHNGDPFSAEDVAWSLTRAANPDTGNPIQFIWGKVENVKAEGNRVTADVKEYEPTFFKWMSFLTGYVMPKKYMEEVGADGFEAAPIGTGPYMVEKFERNVTLEVPYEEFDRLKEKDGLAGITTPISDIAMIFLNDIEVMTDPNVRKAAAHAIDKPLIIDRLLSGYGVAIDTLQTPDYAAYDESIKVAYDPEMAKELLAASGYSLENPGKFTIQSTRGFKPKDYEMVQAIVGLWRRVGIEAEIEVYEIAKHFELRAADQLAPAAFYNWGNSVGDPTTSTGFAMFGPSPHSVWDGQDTFEMILPLWAEPDEEKRIAGWKEVDRHIAAEAQVIPLLQYVQPIVHANGVKVVPHRSGALLPHLMTRG